MKNTLLLLTLLFVTLTKQAFGLSVSLQSDSQFSLQAPFEKWSWGGFMNFPGYYEHPDYDYLAGTLSTFNHAIEDEIVLDQKGIDLVPLVRSLDEVIFRVVTILNINPNGDIGWNIFDMQSVEKMTLSGNAGAKVVPGQDLWINTYGDYSPKGTAAAYYFEITEGVGPVQVFDLRARSTSDGDENELTSMKISGWNGTSPLSIKFYAGAILDDDLAEYRFNEVAVIGVVPEPTTTMSLLGGLGVFGLLRRRKS